MELWGIDLGGTKIEGVILPDLTSTEPVLRHRISTEAQGGYEHIVARLVQLVSEMENLSGLRCESVGLGGPGTLDPKTAVMRNCNTTSLIGKPLPQDFSAAIGRPVVYANDANCFALAEAKLGAGIGFETVFGVIMGTGVGGGVVVDGHVLNGAQGIGGEWGHNVLEPDGFPCYCGKRGCVETVLSGPALERYYSSLSGRPLRLPAIVEGARSGDDAAVQTINHLTAKFGEAISVVVNILDPHVLVLGGGVGNIDALYTDGVTTLTAWVLNSHLETKVVRPKLGDSAGVFGAAHLVA